MPGRLPEIHCFVPDSGEGEHSEPIDLEDTEAVEKAMARRKSREKAKRDWEKSRGIRRDSRGKIIPTYTPGSH